MLQSWSVGRASSSGAGQGCTAVAPALKVLSVLCYLGGVVSGMGPIARTRCFVGFTAAVPVLAESALSRDRR